MTSQPFPPADETLLPQPVRISTSKDYFVAVEHRQRKRQRQVQTVACRRSRARSFELGAIGASFHRLHARAEQQSYSGGSNRCVP